MSPPVETPTESRSWLPVIIVSLICVIGLGVTLILAGGETNVTPEERFNQSIADEFQVDFTGEAHVYQPNVDFTDADGDGNIDYYIFVGCFTKGENHRDVDPAAWSEFEAAASNIDGTESIRLREGAIGTDSKPVPTMTITVNLDDSHPQNEAEFNTRSTLGELRHHNPCAP